MIIVTDTREQQPLEFPKVKGVEYVREGLMVGDYGARIRDKTDDTVFERKSIADLFNSFTGGYDQERAKIVRARELGLHYVLAIEATATEVLKGHSYWKDGELHESRKTGIAMIRQLATIRRKYQIETWFCQSRREMAWMIQEHFLAAQRLGSVEG